MDATTLIARYSDAVASFDADRLIDLYTSDARVFDSGSAWQYRSAEEWAAAVREWFDPKWGMRDGACDVTQVVELTAPDLVVVSGLVRYTAEGHDGRTEMLTRLTQVWRREGDDWLIAHEHTSVPLDEEMTAPLPPPA